MGVGRGRRSKVDGYRIVLHGIGVGQSGTAFTEIPMGKWGPSGTASVFTDMDTASK